MFSMFTKSIGRKLGSAFGLLLLIFVGIGVVVFILNSKITDDAREVAENDTPGAVLSLQLLDELGDMNSNVLQYIAGEADEADAFQGNLEEFRGYFEELKPLQTLPEEVVVMQEMETLLQQYVNAVENDIFGRFDPELLASAKVQANVIEREYGDPLEALLDEAAEDEYADSQRTTDIDEAVHDDMPGIRLYLSLVDETGDMLANINEYVAGEQDEAEEFASNAAEFEGFLSELKPLELNAGEIATLNEIEGLYNQIKDGGEAIFASYNPQDLLDAEETTEELEAAQLARLEAILDTMVDEASDHALVASSDIVSRLNEVTYITISAIVVAAIAGVVLGVMITRGITIPLGQLVQVAGRVSAGDLSARAQVNSRDETGQLSSAINEMIAGLQESLSTVVAKEYLEGMINRYMEFVAGVSEGDLTQRLELARNGTGEVDVNDDLIQLGENLNLMVGNLAVMAGQVRETVTAVTSAASEIQAATTQQTASATEQNATVTETVATVEEVRQTVQQTAERARMVAENASKSVEISMQGQQAVDSTVEGMRMIRERVESIAENILMLSEKTQQIGEIIDAVNGLADQSKLLALNASIEAARAGEEGKGFAVVAMEVRQLAEQSRDATSRVQGILSEIQQATNTAVMVTEEGSKGAEQGMSLVEQAGLAIRDLAATIEEAAQAAGQIAASTHQQTSGMEQLAVAMTQIEQATAQAAATTRQTETSVRDLMDMAHMLETAAARYQL